MERNCCPRLRGFTMVEVIVSLAVLGILLTSVFSITVETYAFIGDTDVDYAAQNEANTAFERMTEVLRKSGWSTAGGVSYPLVAAAGKELQFRVLRDLDGNGTPTNATTGDLEWGPTVYRIFRDAVGNLRVYNGATPVWHLCRYATSISFTTYLQDATLNYKEIRVTVQTRKLTRQGKPIDYTLSGSIDMRN